MSRSVQESELKKAVKEALLEAIQENREVFQEMLTEALEDVALVQAIKEGETTEVVSRDEIFDLLGAKR